MKGWLLDFAALAADIRRRHELLITPIGSQPSRFGVWLKEIAAAERAIAEARRIVPPEAWLGFCCWAGLSRGEARKDITLPDRFEGMLPTTVTGARALLDKIDRTFDQLPRRFSRRRAAAALLAHRYRADDPLLFD